jgi:hypothetical protein
MSIQRALLFAASFLVGATSCGRTPASHSRVTGPAGSLHVDDGGKKKSDELPVVFLHGFAG